MKKTFITANIILTVTMVIHVIGTVAMVALSNIITSFPLWAQLLNVIWYIPIFIIENVILIIMMLRDKRKGKEFTTRTGRLFVSVNVSILTAAILTFIYYVIDGLINGNIYWYICFASITKYIPAMIICNCVLIIFAIIKHKTFKRTDSIEKESV